MTPRELVRCALDFHPVERVPLEVPNQVMGHTSDVAEPIFRYGAAKTRGTMGQKGSRLDAWGCLWEAAEDGVKGEVKSPIIDDWARLDGFQAPFEILAEADLTTVNEQCALSDKFLVHMWGIEPFQRLQYLRGTENVLIDLAYGDGHLDLLRDQVHEFYTKEVTLWAATDVDAIHLEDDWGTQRGMIIAPDMWRDYFKPLYRDYCDIAHGAHKYVIMHSDGYIADIIPDLIEIGVDAINAQIDVMNITDLAERFHHRMAFWGGFDRQHLLPFGSADEVRCEVQRIADAFFQYGPTGVIGQCFIDKGADLKNVNALYDSWAEFRFANQPSAILKETQDET